jgi:hypothetical protein
MLPVALVVSASIGQLVGSCLEQANITAQFTAVLVAVGLRQTVHARSASGTGGACKQLAACAQLLGASKHDSPVHSSGELQMFEIEECMCILPVALITSQSDSQ